MLVSPQGAPVSFFSFELKGNDLRYLNPAGKKTAIFQCEFFAVLVALKLWGEVLSSRQVVFYVDNDGVRDVLISCNTADPVGSVLLTSVLELEGARAISSWFTRVPSPIEKAAISCYLAEWFGCGTYVSCALHKGLCGTDKSGSCRNTNEAQPK